MAHRTLRMMEFYGDVAFDTNKLFNISHLTGATPVIKTEKNSSSDRYNGSKYRYLSPRYYEKQG